MVARILNSNLRRLVVLTSSRTQFFGGTKVNITFVNRAQKEFQVKAREGDTVLDTVLDNMIEYDGFGVCGGGIACSTCHVVLDKAVYETTDPESDEEWDMLDNASGLTHTSRLGCCITINDKMEGSKIIIPAGEDVRWKVK